MMNPQKIQEPLVQQLELLTQVIQESPYLSRDGRKGLEQEIFDFSERLKDGMLTLLQGEKALTELNKKAAADEIISLMTKISYLNPSSRRLESLQELSHHLNDEKISPDQARRGIQNLMQG